MRRENQALRTSGEDWRPIPCTEVTPLRRFFDLQAGTIWRDLSDLLPTVRGTLVDVGCGAQPYRRLLEPTVTYIGIDTVNAGEDFGYKQPDTRFYDGVIWPLADAEVETVLATETLEHVPDPGQFLAEAFRVLRPGGRLILTVPFAARWHFVPFDFWRFTPAGLALLFTNSGFVDVAVYARGNAMTVAAYKWLSVLAQVVLPQTRSRVHALALRLVGLVALPFFLIAAIVANASLGFRGGDDCLGYTASAVKPAVPV